LEDARLAALANAPWFAPYTGLLEAATRAGLTRLDVEALCTLSREVRAGVDFMHCAEGLSGDRYEAIIREQALVPTRRGWHDSFNALAWLRFTELKWAINKVHSRDLAGSAERAQRSRARDAATLLDENGVLLVTDCPAMVEALTSFSWKRLFVEKRSHWNTRCRALVVGHGLLEKLMQPHAALTAHALPVLVSARHMRAGTDVLCQLAQEHAIPVIEAPGFAPGVLSPLPVMGIPGWNPANEVTSFYDDTGVFRPRRKRHAQSAGNTPDTTARH
jgi:hypothetical protein